MPKKTMDNAADMAKTIADFYGAALKRPDQMMTQYMAFLQDSFSALTGQSDIQPARGDKRFADPIWQSNPVYKVMMTSYLSWCNHMNDWVDSLDVEGRDKLRAKFLTSLLTDTMAPTNTLVGNPAAMKTTLEKGGSNLVDGAKQLIEDMVHNNGLPSMVDKSKFKVGENLGTTEGAVIYRDDLLELIQYKPQTAKVYKRPIFIVPPQINKFYIWDLSPGRSVVEYLLGQGHQVFVVSWRNPHEEHGDWGMENYVQALDRATEVACDITKSKDLNMVGACSGGITASLLLAYWAAKGIERANSHTQLVAILDVAGAKDTAMGLFANFETLELARMFSRSKGILPGKDLQRAFAWLRPNDLIWAYWVNNYLLGNEPPAFDILYWNADTTNLPGKLHSDMIKLLEQGGLKKGNSWRIADIDIRLDDVTCDKFILGGTTDHITPWEGCYQSMHGFGGKNEFVLSQSGHVQAIINPPGNPRARFMTNLGEHDTPEAFKAGAETNEGSWWDYWATWLGERGEGQKAAPKSLGNKAHAPIMAAPGSYVFEEA